MFPQRRGTLTVDKNKEEQSNTWVCPSCGQRYTTPPTARARIKCQNCGRTFYIEGIDVENRESRKLQDEIQRRRRREVEADNEDERNLTFARTRNGVHVKILLTLSATWIP
ncbi:MAG TPA: hypothetical protein VEF91_03600 [Verrucomicrobiae bacterium]|nr:hypothetical protein [Verrucomicrobiae bacterium]